MKNVRIFLVIILLFVIIIPIVFIFNNKNKSQTAESVLDSTAKENIELLSSDLTSKNVQTVSKKESKSDKKVVENTKENSQKNTSFSYKVKKGDCLWKIAKKIYGDGNLWILIFDKNKEILKNPDMLTANVDLVMPDLNQYKKSDIKNIEHNIAVVNSKKENKDTQASKISQLDNKKIAKIYKEIYDSYKKTDTNANAFDYLIMAKKADPEIFKNQGKASV